MSENKTFFFMAGLQRSGATALSSILNQNPDIHCSPSSPLFPMLTETAKSFKLPQNIDYNRDSGINAVLNNMANNFYSDHEEQYIIDKNHWWPIPLGVDLIYKYITQDIKIICPVRDLIEVLASFNTIIEKNKYKNKNNSVDVGALEHTYDNKPMADRRAEFLMMPKNDIATHLFGMSFAKKPEFRHMFHFIEYNDIVSKPNEVLDNLYDYLGIPRFEGHTFDNLKTEVPAKSMTNIYDLHKVNPKLEKKSVDPRDIFTEETIRRYSGLEFWRGLK